MSILIETSGHFVIAAGTPLTKEEIARHKVPIPASGSQVAVWVTKDEVFDLFSEWMKRAVLRDIDDQA